MNRWLKKSRKVFHHLYNIAKSICAEMDHSGQFFGCGRLAGPGCFGSRGFHKGYSIGRPGGEGHCRRRRVQTIYGNGTIVIPWAEVKRIRSDKELLILYAEADNVVGRIWGIKNGRLLVGESIETVARIPVEHILRSITRKQYDTSRLDRLRVRYRY